MAQILQWLRNKRSGSQPMGGLSTVGLFGFAFFIAYWTSYLMLWARVSQIRSLQTEPAALPSNFSLYLGTATLGYVWSGRHRRANDPVLSRTVFAVRTTQVLLPIGVILVFHSG